MSIANVQVRHISLLGSSAIASQPFSVFTWLGPQQMASQVVKAPATSGILTQEVITNSKYLVDNCRRNAEDNLRNLPIPKILSPCLCNGAHYKDSQPDSPFSLGRIEASASVKYLEL